MSDIDKITTYLIAQYKPKAIILHGSRLRSDCPENSDYDLRLVGSPCEEIYPHEYDGFLLDIDSVPYGAEPILKSGKIPIWPLKILYDEDGIGQQIYNVNEKRYNHGASVLTAQEWLNRKNYSDRLINKILARGSDVWIRRYYLCEMYDRMIRYWFEKRQQWNPVPYLGLEIIYKEDPEYHKLLNEMWQDDYLIAIDQLYKIIFEDKLEN